MIESTKKCPQDPQELEVYQDMSQPLSHYLVNSSFESFLFRVGVASKASRLLGVERCKMRDFARLQRGH